MRMIVLTLGLVLFGTSPASAEWQLTPSFGMTLGGSTTFLVTTEPGVDSPSATFGVRGIWIGEVFGLEADFSTVPGFFQRGFFQFGSVRILPPGTPDALEVRSNVMTLTGNVIAAVPRRLTEYTLRPYAVGGIGLMRVRIDDLAGLPISSTLTAIDIGGGVTGFLSDTVGLNWDIRRFWSVGGADQQLGFSLGDEQLSFWRASMGLAIRF